MDLYRIFKPMIFISRVFCLTPFTAVENSGSTRYKFSIFWLLYSILGVCALFIFQINMFWISLLVSGATIVNVINMVMSATTRLASVVSQVFCLSNGKNVIRILDLVSVLDSEHSGARISYYRLYKVFIVHLIYSIFSLTATHIMNFATINTNTAYRLKFLYFTTLYFICDVLLLSDTQFNHIVFS
jgi:hypothetical protein